MRDFSRRRTRIAAIVASAGLVAAGLLVSSPTTANPGAAAPQEAPSADRPGGHEPQHPLKIKEKRDAQKAEALQRKLKGKKPFPGGGEGQEVPLEVHRDGRTRLTPTTSDARGWPQLVERALTRLTPR